jgi:hypothetical protein
MRRRLTVYIFRDPNFAPAGDTMVCIAPEARLERFIPREELASAFSGYAVYWRWEVGTLWLQRRLRQRYIGVWGARNVSRLRRFLTERGATLVIKSHPPSMSRLVHDYRSEERARVRSLPETS